MDTITPFDWQRMFLGDTPPVFLLEILFRTLLILLWTSVLLRWIGGRSISQLSIAEFLLVIALGSAVGDTLFYPDVPLVHAMLVILVVVLIDKAVDIAIRRWSPVKSVIDGSPVEVLRDGRILCVGMTSRQVGTLELMEMLRLKQIENLGQVRRAYLEASGLLSIFRADPPRPGLPLVPPPEIVSHAHPGADPAACTNCGAVEQPAPATCRHCGRESWTAATCAGA